MSDWKSALRDIKKSISGTEDKKNSCKPEQDTKANAVTNAKPIQHNAAMRTWLAEQDSLKRKLKKADPSPGRQQPCVAASRPTSPALQPKLDKVDVKIEKAGPAKPTAVPHTLTTRQRHPLTRHAYYKAPEAWVMTGGRTQLSPSPGSLPIDIVIGLDFGTSYTKAAVGLKDQIFPVSWEGISAIPERHLLPSEYCVLDDGSCHIGQAPAVPFERVHHRLKHPFIDPAVSSASIARATVFVALVLQYVRAWVFRHHGSKIGASEIRWQLNIGAPSNGLETERLETAYKKLGSMAWLLSLSEIPIKLEKAQEITADLTPDSPLTDLIDLQILPEFVAQIAGYVQSAQRKKGLHALADVGGGTLDIVTFIVHERDDEDVFPFLVPEVKALGTQMLYQNRLVDAPGWNEAGLPDELQPVLDATRYAEATGISERHVHTRDALLWAAIHEVVHNVFYKTKQKRYRLSEAWKTGLPTFLTGGGNRVTGYSSSIKNAGERHANVLNIMPLPLHPRLADFTGGNDEYQRISVACGLALDAFSLGQIVPAKDVEDDVALRRKVTERPDRDELYPH